jgi:predicted TIM-barrel fold metal-dependent hydrolase
MVKVRANSGDSNFLEPSDLFNERLPKRLAERMPRSEKAVDGLSETVYIDGESFTRRLPRPIQDGSFKSETIMPLSARPPGSHDPVLRLRNLDQEGIWGEVTYPSLGLWGNMVKDPELIREGAKALNDWAFETLVGTSTRYVPAALIPLADVDDTVREVERVAEMGYLTVFAPARHSGATREDFGSPRFGDRDALTTSNQP